MTSTDPYLRWLGIPPAEQPPNYYRLLGLPPFESRPEAIEAAAERQAAGLQSTASGPESALVERLLGEIAAARVCLLHPARKMAYDEALRDQMRRGPGAAPPSPARDLPVLLARPMPRADAARAGRRLRRMAAVAAAGVGLVVAAVLLLGPSQTQDLADGTLLIDWPEAHRAGATLAIDGQPHDVPSMGPVEFPCRPGEVRIVVGVAGGKSWERSVTIEPGRKRLVSFNWEALRPPGRSAGATVKPAAAGTKAVATAALTSKPNPAKSLAAASPVPSEPPRDSTSSDTRGAGLQPAKQQDAMPPRDARSPSAGDPSAAPEVPSKAEADPAGAQSAAKEPDRPAPQPPAIAQFDAPLAEAWALIQGREVKQGYDKLLDLFKKDRGDFRVAFSLGLVEALVGRDWQESEKHFAVCQRLQPDHPAMLNNLALVQMRTGQEYPAIRQWESLLAAGPASPEVVQNLRRFQSLAHAGHFRLKPAHIKTIDELASRAAQTGAGFKTNVGYLYLPLKTADGKVLGWPEPRAYHDRWCVVCGGRGAVHCPDRECSKGTVRAAQPKAVFIHPLTKSRIVEYVPVRAACPVCKGEGWIDCKKCQEGIDPNLKDVKDPLSKTQPYS